MSHCVPVFSRTGRPRQVIAASLHVPLVVTDIRHMVAAEQTETSERLIAQHLQQPFYLDQLPLIRTALLRLADDWHILVITMHHSIADGWSFDLLFRELATAYTSYTHGQQPDLPVLSLQYADFAYWQRHWLQGQVQTEQLRYWQEQLHAAPALLDLPTDYARPPEQSFRGDVYRHLLPSKLIEQVVTVGRPSGATLFMTLLAAWAVLLARYSRQMDLLIGTPIANRTRSDIEGLVGFFANTLVLRLRLAPNMSFRALLQQTREVTLNAYTHQDVPFEALVEVLQPERTLRSHPLFQVMVDSIPRHALVLPGLAVEHMPVHTGTAKFDLTLLLEERDDGMMAVWEYATDLFADTTIKRMAGHFCRAA
ncbi:MAG: hypothetical protein HC837_12235 [Chloroflexaceae bacterium]|nr:hypothetical protein [Chloroflexaceae bacterium]